MDSEKRKTLSLKARLPNLGNIKALANKLTSYHKNGFVNKYGNILDFLTTNVQIGAITALAQFYDPPMRSFLFKDFQLAPTIEEFERIVGIPGKGKGRSEERRVGKECRSRWS